MDLPFGLLQNPVVRKAPGHTRYEAVNTNYPLGHKLYFPIREQPFEVVDTVMSGSKGAVYHLVCGGEHFALKLPLRVDARVEKELKEEVARDVELRKLGFPSAEIVWSGTGQVLKYWIDGTLGIDWYENWIQDSLPLNDPGYLGLLALFEKCCALGVFLDGINPENVIWSDTGWVIIDSKNIKERGLQPEEAMKKIAIYLNRRWGGPLPHILWDHWYSQFG
jgi:hypothetical protein